MSDDLRESLSALMDGEASELELRRLLKSDDPSIRQSWVDYHRLRETLTDGDVAFADMDVSGRVAEAIDSESTSGRWRDLVRPVGGLAVAAGVAAVVVFGARQLNTPAVDQVATAESGSVGRVYPGMQGNLAVDSGDNVASSSGAREIGRESNTAAQRFERYMERHTERAALNGVQGVVSYARVASHKAE